MTPWQYGPLCLLDFETTGVDPHRDRIVTAAVIEVIPGHDKRHHDWLINPGIEIPEGASRIHGISTEQAQASGAEPAGAIWEIAELLLRATASGACVVGHNISYDLTMLWAELQRHGMAEQADKIALLSPIVDTFVLDKWADTYRKGSRRLVDVARHYGVELSEQDAHGAAADALAAGRIAWHLAHKYQGLQVSGRELHSLQIQWKREQAESFGKYLLKQGKVDDVAREWPLQYPPTGWTPEKLPVAREAVAS